MKKCPACEKEILNENEVENSLSRFSNIYICSDCGVRESFEGFFWKETSFEEFLQEYWMDNISEGQTKDQIEDAYENWLSQLDVQELIDLADLAIKKALKK